MVNYGDNLGRPDRVIRGRFAHVLWHGYHRTTATPIPMVSLRGVQDVGQSPISFDEENKVLQFGGGNEALLEQVGPEYSGSIQLLAYNVNEAVAAFLNKTFGAGGEYALPMNFPTYHLGALETHLRDDDNNTHIQTLVYQDLIFKPFARPTAFGNNMATIPFISRHEPFEIPAACEFVVDKFDGDGSTSIFTLAATPLNLVTSADEGREDWDYDTVAFVQVKLSGSNVFNRQKTGVEITSTTVTFTTPPAASSEIIVGYVKATA